MSVAEGFVINSVGDEVPAKQLRVFRSLDFDKDPLTSDFSILGFRKKAPHYDRGRKTKAEYHCAINDDMIVEKIFSDILENGKLSKLQIEFRWFCEDGTIGLTKTEIVEDYSKAKAKTVLRERRERSIDFLISEGEDTPVEPIMNALISHYENVKDDYIKYGNDSFANAILNETDPTMNGYLDIRVPFTSDNNFNVPIRESILYQIGSLDEAGLLATLQPAT